MTVDQIIAGPSRAAQGAYSQPAVTISVYCRERASHGEPFCARLVERVGAPEPWLRLATELTAIGRRVGRLPLARIEKIMAESSLLGLAIARYHDTVVAMGHRREDQNARNDDRPRTTRRGLRRAVRRQSQRMTRVLEPQSPSVRQAVDGRQEPRSIRTHQPPSARRGIRLGARCSWFYQRGTAPFASLS